MKSRAGLKKVVKSVKGKNGKRVRRAYWTSAEEEKRFSHNHLRRGMGVLGSALGGRVGGTAGLLGGAITGGLIGGHRAAKKGLGPQEALVSGMRTGIVAGGLGHIAGYTGGSFAGYKLGRGVGNRVARGKMKLRHQRALGTFAMAAGGYLHARKLYDTVQAARMA